MRNWILSCHYIQNYIYNFQTRLQTAFFFFKIEYPSIDSIDKDKYLLIKFQ